MLVKLSSLGDVVHTLPALTDAAAALPGIRFDWVVEEAFAEVPAWHPAVDRVIPVALRRWRRHPLDTAWLTEWRAVKRALGGLRHDAVIDAQSLLKSAWIARYARGPRCGLDWHSAREPLASAGYDRRFAVARNLHAVERVRRLFAQALGYALPATAQDYGLSRASFAAAYPGNRDAHTQASRWVDVAQAPLVFLHGSARVEKCWPEHCWAELIRLAVAAGERVLLPWGSEEERARAGRLKTSAGAELVQVLPRMSLTALAQQVCASSAAVAVDTGLGHLCAALAVPTVSLYGPTQVERVGTRGAWQRHVCAAPGGSLATIPPAEVWRALGELRARALSHAPCPGHLSLLSLRRVAAGFLRHSRGALRARARLSCVLYPVGGRAARGG
ncbi:MAG: lipopolysaccharide heptosyltransferase I [Halioglobus sp.]